MAQINYPIMFTSDILWFTKTRSGAVKWLKLLKVWNIYPLTFQRSMAGVSLCIILHHVTRKGWLCGTSLWTHIDDTLLTSAGGYRVSYHKVCTINRPLSFLAHTKAISYLTNKECRYKQNKFINQNICKYVLLLFYINV